MYNIYYRNYLKSCNYRCEYCPFPKEVVSEKMIERDKKYLIKFVNYINHSNHHFNIFFAPKGEALTYDYYKKALIDLTKFENVNDVVIQTNLTCSLEWLKAVNPAKLILWISYHPSQISATSFFNKIKELTHYNCRFSVGSVGVKESFESIQKMRSLLNELGKDKPYIWVNAYKDRQNYYTLEEIEFLEGIDPLFKLNLKDYDTKGIECRTGEDVFFVEWNGTIHRCWYDKVKIANLYVDELESINSNSSKSKCKNSKCGCFIGYSNIKNLNLEKVYKNSLIGRIP